MSKSKPQEITLDFDRENRTGLSEAVMCSNKSLDQLQAIVDTLQESAKAMLFTRLSASVYQGLTVSKGSFDYDEVSRTACYRSENAAEGHPKTGAIAVVTGGTSDIPVAKEAVQTLAFYGQQAQEINDIGVAGLWRVQEHLDDLKNKQVIICIAGMDAALPTVLGGLVPGLIIAVPSSVGYGMAKGGETALNALLCSCAQGLVVVNIDNGFGAACAALRTLK